MQDNIDHNSKTTSGPAETSATPMMAQYMDIKRAHPDHLLFYRMGDFYELFFEDAVKAAETLAITLTRRGKHLGNDIPMCGVPVHAADEYLHRLIRAGHRVAVCEQMEDPAAARKRGSKAVVRREVVRLVTPGTLTEDSLLEARRHNYLVALARPRSTGEAALAWLDISTGAFAVTTILPDTLGAELSRLDPGEIVLPEPLLAEGEFRHTLRERQTALTALPASRFDSTAGERRLKDYFKVAALDAFGNFTRAEVSACGALLDYVALTQVGRMPAIQPPVRCGQADTMLMDPATRGNLEILRTSSGEHRGSLVSVIDRTVTGPGARLLADRLAAPLTHAGAINERLDAVQLFVDAPQLRSELRDVLKTAPDIARALSRLAVGRGGPRDLAAIRDGLKVAHRIAGLLEGVQHLAGLPTRIVAIRDHLAHADTKLTNRLDDALAQDLPISARDGGFVRVGYSSELDEQRRLRDDSRKVIAGLQTQYADATGVRALKVRHNNVLGYFVEVPAQHGERLMAPPLGVTFIHRQTLANAVRFTTAQLGEIEQRVAMAGERALGIELAVFDELVKETCAHSTDISAIADSLAETDLHAALAELAQKERYTRPTVDETRAFRVVEGRHPVVEQAIKAGAEGAFIPNDCMLSADVWDEADERVASGRHIWLVTGPNMAGKSTFLRQNALIAILAQMGAFVPAAGCHLGVVDRLFSRVGAADDLARGRSTFMVEMVETATILNQASERSLVILDEIGRGTATFDGLSIAWACVEHLHEMNRCRALFATHFHELTALADRLQRLANVTMKVREWRGEVIFLHEVGAGAADRSYGIQVARLAGLPDRVIARANEVLNILETSERASERRALADDLPLFSAARPSGTGLPESLRESAVENVLRDILPDELSPREALDLVYELKARLNDK